VHAGDAVQFVRNGQQWQTDFFDVISAHNLNSVPWLTTRGNHDDWAGISPLDKASGVIQSIDDAQRDHYLRVNSVPYFAVSIGFVRVLVLDANDDSDAQLQWFERELKSAAHKAARFRIVLVHIPPFMEFWDPVTWAKGENRWGDFIRYYLCFFTFNLQRSVYAAVSSKCGIGDIGTSTQLPARHQGWRGVHDYRRCRRTT
jgi:hypothetical protein